jgi:hypothetical protein
LVEEPEMVNDDGVVKSFWGIINVKDDIWFSSIGPIVPSVVMSPVIVTVGVVNGTEAVNGNETIYVTGSAAAGTMWARAAIATPTAYALLFQDNVRRECPLSDRGFDFIAVAPLNGPPHPPVVSLLQNNPVN